MSAVYVSIGNSDDKLTQLDWMRFCCLVEGALRLEAGQVYGVWYSAPVSQYQNMCAAAEVDHRKLATLRTQLGALAAEFGQDSIALAVAEKTEFIAPATEGGTS